MLVRLPLSLPLVQPQKLEITLVFMLNAQLTWELLSWGAQT